MSAASAEGVRFLLDCESSGGRAAAAHADVDSAVVAAAASLFREHEREVGALSLLLASGASLASPRLRSGVGKAPPPYSPDSPLPLPLGPL
jgi:hypothetical protein